MVLTILLAWGCGGGGASETNPSVSISSLSISALTGTDSASASLPPSTCQEHFSPERVAAGENCVPVAGSFCPLVASGNPLLPPVSVPACSGVSVSRQAITAAGFTTEYLAIRPSSGTPESIYLQLHYLGTQVNIHANQLRLAELAKARNVLILVPQAPNVLPSLPLPETLALPLPSNPLPPLSGSDVYGPLVPTLESAGLSVPRWPNDAGEPIAQYVDLLDAVVADGRQRFRGIGLPLYVGGLSNGAVMAYHYGCARPDQVLAVLAAGANLGQDMLAACPPLAAVIVHGTADFVAPYVGFGLSAGADQTYTYFKSVSGCGGADLEATIPGDLNGDPLPVSFRYTAPCSNGRRMYLVTVNGGGHTWPDADDNTAGLSFNNFGPISRNWDATLYGYDLMKMAAGR